MEWLDMGAYLTLLTGIGTVWWRLNSRSDTLARAKKVPRQVSSSTEFLPRRERGNVSRIAPTSPLGRGAAQRLS